MMSAWLRWHLCSLVSCFMMCWLMGLHAGYAEPTGRVSLHVHQMPLRTALRLLAAQSPIHLVYVEDLVENITVTGAFDQVSVEQALGQLLDQTALTFQRMSDNQLVLVRRPSSSVIAGRILDRTTGNPVEGAIVFLVNTTIGTSTGPDGRYRLTRIPSGSYQLMVRHLGYEPTTLQIQFFRPDSLYSEFALIPHVLELGREVQVIAPAPTAWRKQLQRFTKEFLGDSDNARVCRILNPEVLTFSVDPKTDVFRASADSLIRIENRAFGYRLHILLGTFSVSDTVLEYTTYPRFEELEPRSESERQQWIHNRQQSYQGSFKHFLSALARGKLDEEQFIVWQTHDPTMGLRARIRSDSLTIVSPDMDGLYRVQFPGYLEVAYGLEHSVIQLKQGSALIDTLEAVYTPSAFTKYGVWGQDRLGDVLPADYEPDQAYRTEAILQRDSPTDRQQPSQNGPPF